MALGDMIAELREDKGIRQKDLAKLLNVSRPTISNYEANIHKPSIEGVIKMADFFDVSLDYFLERIRFNVDLKELNEPYIRNELLTGDLLKILLYLKPKSRNALIEYVNLLKLKDSNE